MRITIRGNDEGVLNIAPDDNIALVKFKLGSKFLDYRPGIFYPADKIRENFRQEYEVTMTFSNGETLLPVVWESNEYDHVTFEHYKDVIEGGTINLVPRPEPGYEQVINRERVIDEGVNRGEDPRITELYDFISGEIGEGDYRRIRNRRFIEIFGTYTYGEFLTIQLELLRRSSLNDLLYYYDTMTRLRNADQRKILYIKVTVDDPRGDPQSFCLMPDGRIVLLA